MGNTHTTKIRQSRTISIDAKTVAAPLVPGSPTVVHSRPFPTFSQDSLGVGDGVGVEAMNLAGQVQGIAGSEVEFQLVLVLLNTFPQGRPKTARAGAPTWKEV